MLYDEFSSSISIIDFGLSQVTTEIEYFGLDLHVLKESLDARHPLFLSAMEFVIQGYVQACTGVTPLGQHVKTRYEKILSRVRYHG